MVLPRLFPAPDVIRGLDPLRAELRGPGSGPGPGAFGQSFREIRSFMISFVPP